MNHQKCLCDLQQASKVGVTDVVCHIDSKMHQNDAKSVRSQTALTFTRPSSSLKRYCNELTMFHSSGKTNLTFVLCVLISLMTWPISLIAKQDLTRSSIGALRGMIPLCKCN